MNSTSGDSCHNTQYLSSDNEDIIAISTLSRIYTTAPVPSYTPDQLQRLLKHDKEKFRVINNESTKPLTSWWRSFGYPALLNEKNEFERIPGFITCFKCFHTSVYGPNSETKRFISHADRCSPRVLSHPSPSGANDSQSTQFTLDNMVLKRNTKLTDKEQNELKELYAKWVCRDIRPFSIVEDKGFEERAQTFIQIGEDAQYGFVDVKDVLRSRQTVAHTVDDLALKYRVHLKNELVEPLKSKAVTICPDFWSNKYNQQAFLGINITYVTADNEFKSVDLFCIPFNGIKSRDQILEEEKSQINPSSINHNSPATAKSNLIHVIPDENSLSESESELSELEVESQELNVIKGDTLVKFKEAAYNNSTKMSLADIPPVAKKVILLLKQTKDLVKYVKQSGLNQEIKTAGGTIVRQHHCMIYA